MKLCIMWNLNFEFIDDEERLREELKDLIDDNPIEESDAESDASGKIFKKSFYFIHLNKLNLQDVKSVRNQMMRKI